jgi:hypothetical protein
MRSLTSILETAYATRGYQASVGRLSSRLSLQHTSGHIASGMYSTNSRNESTVKDFTCTYQKIAIVTLTGTLTDSFQRQENSNKCQEQVFLAPLPVRFHFVLFTIHGFSVTLVPSTFSAIAMSLLFANSVHAARRTSPPPPLTLPALMLTL